MLVKLDKQKLLHATDWLSTQDDALARVHNQYGPPPLWTRAPGFSSLVHLILEQQVSLASAQAAFNRLQAFSGTITPAGFLKINDQDLLEIGFSRQKKRYVRGLAKAINNGDLLLEPLEGLPDDLVKLELKKVVGIGDWTADNYLLFCLQRPDILPKGDIALYEAIRSLLGLEKRPDYEQFLQRTEHWRPWRSVGARLLWHFYLCERGRT